MSPQALFNLPTRWLYAHCCVRTASSRRNLVYCVDSASCLCFLTMIFQQVCIWFFCLFCLGVQGRGTCNFNDEFYAGDLAKGNKFYGRWYLIMQASSTKAGLEKVTKLDNAIYTLIKRDDLKMFAKGDVRAANADACIHNEWMFHVNSATKHMMRDDIVHREYRVYSPDCKNCMILRETQKTGKRVFDRILLYARKVIVCSTVRDDFRTRANCWNMNEIFVLPQKLAFCA
ncbi:uncharacterized protein LOC103172341 [Callorhinchus milii]|nr:uncharacterized protein LOC103172341 [Callorhinchus milii]